MFFFRFFFATRVGVLSSSSASLSIFWTVLAEKVLLERSPKCGVCGLIFRSIQLGFMDMWFVSHL